MAPGAVALTGTATSSIFEELRLVKLVLSAALKDNKGIKFVKVVIDAII